MLKKLFRTSLGWVLRAAPAGTAGFIYTRLLKPRPLRYVINRVLTSLLPKTISIPEGTIELNAHDPVVSGALALGVYEPLQTRLFREAIRDGMTVLDIGANLGYHTVIAARRAGPDGRVLAFEPEPANFALLERNVHRNGFQNVGLCKLAISDTAGTRALHLSDSNKGKHSLVMTRDDSPDYSESISVETTTVDGVLADMHISNVDVIKIDIEGAEPLALDGMTRVLSLPRLTLFVEFSPSAIRRSGSDAVDFLEKLLSYGFRLFEIRESALRLIPIDDPHHFVKKFTEGAYTNLLCTKEDLDRNVPVSSTRGIAA